MYFIITSFLIFSLQLTLSFPSFAALNLKTETENGVTIGDFSFGFSPESVRKRGKSVYYSSEAMAELFDEFYYSDRVLKNRGLVQPDRQTVKFPSAKGELNVETHVIKNFISGLEEGIVKGLINHLFFPDAGHAHILLPTTRPKPALNDLRSIEKALNNGDFALLLHVKEQFDWNSSNVSDCEKNAMLSQRNLVYHPHNVNKPGEAIQVLNVADHTTTGNFIINGVPGYYGSTSSKSIYFHSSKNGVFTYYNEKESKEMNIDFTFKFY